MKRILIVDDNEENLYLLRVLLEGHGYEVEQAANGSEALVKALASKQDVIISDILMPVMDGFTLCKTLKADDRLKHIPLIFYTATYTDSKDEKLALDLGANAFIIKPTEPDEFMRRIEEILAASKDGKLSASQKQTAGNETVLKEYNEVLIKKLEQKMLSLEQANNELEAEIAARKQAEAGLRKKEIQYRNLVDTGLALIWLAGTDKLCNYFNQPWLKFTGRTLEQEMGNGWTQGVHPDDLDRCVQIYVTAFDKREAFDMEYRLRHVSGEYRWIRDLGTPSYDFSGQFMGYIGHCFDITAQREAESQRKSAIEEIRKLNEELEQRVDQRTAELTTKTNELERINKVFVDRELRMRELKARIAELEKQET